MDYYLIAYIFLVLIVMFQAASSMFGSGRTWAGIIVFVTFILIFSFYGMRWFRGDKFVGSYSGAWPPVINTCPDYLTYFKKPTGVTGKFEDTCIDLIGIQRSGASITLAPWSPTDSPANPPADSSGKYFKFVYRPGMTASDLDNLCSKSKEYGLTWEGITNGESCTFSSKVTV